MSIIKNLDETGDHEINTIFDGQCHEMSGYVYIECVEGLVIKVRFTGECDSKYNPPEYEDYGGRRYTVWEEEITDENWNVEVIQLVEAWEDDEETSVPAISVQDYHEIIDCINTAISNHIESNK